MRTKAEAVQIATKVCKDPEQGPVHGVWIAFLHDGIWDVRYKYQAVPGCYLVHVMIDARTGVPGRCDGCVTA